MVTAGFSLGAWCDRSVAPKDIFFVTGGLFGGFAAGIKGLLMSRLLSGIGLGISASRRKISALRLQSLSFGWHIFGRHKEGVQEVSRRKKTSGNFSTCLHCRGPQHCCWKMTKLQRDSFPKRQVSPPECRGWHSAKHGLYIATGVVLRKWREFQDFPSNSKLRTANPSRSISKVSPTGQTSGMVKLQPMRSFGGRANWPATRSSRHGSHSHLAHFVKDLLWPYHAFLVSPKICRRLEDASEVRNDWWWRAILGLPCILAGSIWVMSIPFAVSVIQPLLQVSNFLSSNTTFQLTLWLSWSARHW